MKLDYFKQIDKLICEETNVKNHSYCVCDTDKGLMQLNYDLEKNEYYWIIGKKRLEITNEENVARILTNIYNGGTCKQKV